MFLELHKAGLDPRTLTSDQINLYAEALARSKAAERLSRFNDLVISQAKSSTIAAHGRELEKGAKYGNR